MSKNEKPRYTTFHPGERINKKNILRFYQVIAFPDFMDITDERKVELDDLVKKWTYYFRQKATGKLTLMTILSEKLTVSAKWFGLLTNSERAYFYIQMVDPELKHLVIHEITNTKEEHKQYLRIYDSNLLALEKAFNFRFKQYDLEELRTQDDESLIKKMQL